MPPVPRTSVQRQPTNHDPLIAGYDELNALWKQAEEKLAAMRVSVPVEVEVKDFYHGDPDVGEPEWLETEFLGWQKPEKNWRICFGIRRRFERDETSWEWTPVAECPMEKRVELAEHFLKLKTKMEEARQKLLPQVRGAIACLKQALAD